MDKYCVEHGVEYGGSFCPACDLQVKLDEMTRFEAAKESDLQVECREAERLKEELDEMTRIDAKLFNDLRAERDKAEAEVERLQETVVRLLPAAERAARLCGSGETYNFCNEWDEQDAKIFEEALVFAETTLRGEGEK